MCRRYTTLSRSRYRRTNFLVSGTALRIYHEHDLNAESYLIDDVLVVARLGEEETEEDGEERGLRDAPQEQLHVRRRADQLRLRHLSLFNHTYYKLNMRTL